MNVADEVKEPGESDSTLLGFDRFAHDALVLGDCCEDVYLCWRLAFDCLALRSERPIDLMPLCAMLGFVPGADVVGPACGEHEEHFGAL